MRVIPGDRFSGESAAGKAVREGITGPKKGPHGSHTARDFSGFASRHWKAHWHRRIRLEVSPMQEFPRSVPRRPILPKESSGRPARKPAR
jgi:hypothetical protein